MARKRRENATEPPVEIKVEGHRPGAKKCMKRSDEKLHESGKYDSFAGGRDADPSLLDSAEGVSPKGQRILTHFKVPAQDLSILDLHSGKALQPSGKMKLQLFPVDDHTCEGLEKDGFHPYLELTLSSRKKISSVLKHLNGKWGSSKIACGEPILYPYDRLAKSAGHRWTVNGNSITAGDVYTAIGAPVVFRLRYGWSSSDRENKTSESPSLATFSSSTACLKSEGTQKMFSSKAESTDPTRELITAGANSFTRPSVDDKAPNPIVSQKIPPEGQVHLEDGHMNDCSGVSLFSWDDGLTNLSIGGLLSEASSKVRFGDCGKSSNAGNATLWDDNLTNISIGGLLSEASLQGRSKNCEQQPNVNDENQPNRSVGCVLSEASLQGRYNEYDKTWNMSGTSMHLSPLISDSFDAFLSGQTDQPKNPGPAPPQPCFSILDGEDTCHAFSFAKSSSSAKGTASRGGDVKSTISNMGQDGAESVTDTKTDQATGQAEGMQDHQAQQESHKHLLLSSQVFNQDSSLGLSGIKWAADSLGPFDLGTSMSRKLINGDSIGFSAVVNNI